MTANMPEKTEYEKARDERLLRMLKYCEVHMIEPEQLDDLVIDCALRIASATNNGGVVDQLEFVADFGTSFSEFLDFVKEG